jgi:RNA polymerase sigma factor (sigma-70 family)
MVVATGAGLDEIEAVYRARYRELLGIAAAFSGNLEAGRDAVHDAFVSAVRSRSSFRREGTVEAWLWQAVVRSALKRRPTRVTTRGELAPPVAEAEPEDAGDVADLRAAIAALPERQRHVLFLRHYADLDYESIAQALGIRRGTVAATLHAAHRTLRKAFEEVPTR